MELHIITKNDVEVNEAIREYAEKRIRKITRHLPAISEGKMEVSQEKTKLPEQRFAVQVTLNSRGTLIRSQERAKDIRTAIDRVVDALTSRVERYKGKLYDKGKGMSLTRREATEETEKIEAPKKVVKSKHFLVKSMLSDEATDQMELLGHDFFLFIDADTGKLNLLYRRKDGNYGLIEPEIA